MAGEAIEFECQQVLNGFVYNFGWQALYTGKIWRINPSVDPQTRTFDAEALIENHEGLLKPGFFVKASIPSRKVDSVLLIPQRALNYAYGIYKVYLLTDTNKLKEREVRVGDRIAEDVEVISGLKEGDRLGLPAEGQELAMRDGASVKLAGKRAKERTAASASDDAR